MTRDYVAALSDEVQALARDFDLSTAVRRTIRIDVMDDPQTLDMRVRMSLVVGGKECAFEHILSRIELHHAVAPEDLFRRIVFDVATELFTFANPHDTSDLTVRR